VRSLFGWTRCDKNGLSFENCLGEACLGAPNSLLAGKYRDVNGSDPATIDQIERCAHGHANPPINNTRCSQCALNFAPVSSSGGKCIPCTGDSGQGDTAILIIIGVVAFSLFALLIALKMKSSGKKKAAHSTLKRTLLTHLQMISIVMSLNVQWPETVRTILVGISGIISISGHTSALHCSSVNTLSIADIHYATLSIAAILPVVVWLVSWSYWFICVPKVPVLGCSKNLRHSKCTLKKNPFVVNTIKTSNTKGTDLWKSTRDGWIATNVTFVYIVFPSIVRMSFETFQVQNICGMQYLAMDDTELFEGKRRQLFAEYVALPALLLYMFLLPILTMVYLWKQHSVMFTDRKMVFRFGLLYSGYVNDRWYWEIFVVARKIVLIFIVTFGRSNESQLHFALGVLICVLYLQERGKPFEEHTESILKKEKQQQHMLHLSEVSSLVVLLIMVWVAGFFNVSSCTEEAWDCVVLSSVVFCSNLLFVATCSYVGCRAFAEKNHLAQKVVSMSNIFRKNSSADVIDVINPQKRGTALRQSTEFNEEMFPEQSIEDKAFGNVTLKTNPLADGLNRLSFAKEQRAASGKSAEVELTVID
jgi:hypothetical protein